MTDQEVKIENTEEIVEVEDAVSQELAENSEIKKESDIKESGEQTVEKSENIQDLTNQENVPSEKEQNLNVQINLDSQNIEKSGILEDKLEENKFNEEKVTLNEKIDESSGIIQEEIKIEEKINQDTKLEEIIVEEKKLEENLPQDNVVIAPSDEKTESNNKDLQYESIKEQNFSEIEIIDQKVQEKANENSEQPKNEENKGNADLREEVNNQNFDVKSQDRTLLDTESVDERIRNDFETFPESKSNFKEELEKLLKLKDNSIKTYKTDVKLGLEEFIKVEKEIDKVMITIIEYLKTNKVPDSTDILGEFNTLKKSILSNQALAHEKLGNLNESIKLDGLIIDKLDPLFDKSYARMIKNLITLKDYEKADSIKKRLQTVFKKDVMDKYVDIISNLDSLLLKSREKKVEPVKKTEAKIEKEVKTIDKKRKASIFQYLFGGFVVVGSFVGLIFLHSIRNKFKNK